MLHPEKCTTLVSKQIFNANVLKNMLYFEKSSWLRLQTKLFIENTNE